MTWVKWASAIGHSVICRRVLWQVAQIYLRLTSELAACALRWAGLCRSASRVGTMTRPCCLSATHDVACSWRHVRLLCNNFCRLWVEWLVGSCPDCALAVRMSSLDCGMPVYPTKANLILTQAWKQTSGDPGGQTWNYRGITLLYNFTKSRVPCYIRCRQSQSQSHANEIY